MLAANHSALLYPTKMNLLSATALIGATVALKNHGAIASEPNENLRFVRHLQANVGFLVSQVVDTEDWCITATNGVGSFVPLGLQLCDFDNAPVDQLWQVDGEGKFGSQLDTDFCMIVNDGSSIADNDVVNIAPCDTPTDLNKFFWDAGNTDQLRPAADPSFCVTHLGPLPQDTDDIRVKLCTDERRYKWNFSVHNPYFLLQSESYAGCIELKDGKLENDNSLVLGPCNTDQQWRYDADGLFHSFLDDSKCMQAARGGSIRDGSKMRFFTCNTNERGQVFEFNEGGQISLKSDPNLCVVFRGINPQFNVDPIILKNCDAIDPGDRLQWNRVST